MTPFTVLPYRVRARKAKLNQPASANDLDFYPKRPDPTVMAFRPRKKRARLINPYVTPTLPPVAARVRAGVHPTYDECFATADHVYEEHRGPQITPTGVLDERGVMLCRVTMPIKQQLGINTGGNSWTGDYDEDVEALVPADMLRISTGGGGVSEIDASEYDDEDFDEDEED